jgi:hypothetical protein
VWLSKCEALSSNPSPAKTQSSLPSGLDPLDTLPHVCPHVCKVHKHTILTRGSHAWSHDTLLHIHRQTPPHALPPASTVHCVRACPSERPHVPDGQAVTPTEVLLASTQWNSGCRPLRQAIVPTPTSPRISLFPSFLPSSLPPSLPPSFLPPSLLVLKMKPRVLLMPSKGSAT